MCCFFFKQKPAYELRISDWSSDVCSSDLLVPGLTILQVLVLRWLDPPTSMVMLAQRFESRDVAGFELDYRWRDWQSLSPQVPIALVAAEDQQFPAHHGFEIGRAHV